VFACADDGASRSSELEKTVSHLIDAAARSGNTFERNGKRYGAREEAAHLSRTYRRAKNRIHTAEDFIRLVASGSAVSGKPYRVITPGGEWIAGSRWFTDVLERYRNKTLFTSSRGTFSEESLKVMTLNIAHARRGGAKTLGNDADKIRRNLEDIVAVLKRERPVLVALQEADSPSSRENNFDHVAFIARGAGYPHVFRGEHVKKKHHAYGTALLSRLPLGDSKSVTFPPSPPTPLKGFVVSTVRWPFGNETLDVDVVSLHLDFSRKSVRLKQVEALAATLGSRAAPRIVMGDFNCDARKGEKTIRELAKRLDLELFQPFAVGMETFAFPRRRLDWILVSPRFRFVEYARLNDRVSDHFGVQARIVLDS
jgi:endonuclease/exonuclease/phosphatase family metal-dependent hydrolase